MVPSRVAVLCAILLLTAFPARAQSQERGTITGTVSGPTGAALSGASVDLSDPAGTVLRRTATGSAGRYVFGSVDPGTYQVRARLPGFRAGTSTVAVSGSETHTVNISLSTAVLEELVVTASRDEQELSNVAAAVSVVSREDVQLGRKATNLEESLRRVPGVRVEDELGGTGSRTRIIIRGTGTRANSPAGSGVRGVKVLVDGIPKNNAGGSAQDLINIDLESVERIEVLKGPSSALYGNQSGGVVNIITEEAPRGSTVQYRQTLGSYDLFREHIKVGGRGDRASWRISGFRTDQEGFRRHSVFTSTGFDSKLTYTFDDRSRLTTLIAFDRNFQESPGPLTETQFNQDIRQADSVFIASDVRSVVEEFRFGLNYRREVFGQDVLDFTGYYIPRHLGPFFQIGVRIPQDFTNRGANLRYLVLRPVLGRGNRFTIGVDVQNTPITTGIFSLTTGAAAAETEEHASTAGVYALEEFSLRPDLTFTLGGRFDHVRYSSSNLVRPGSFARRIYEKFTPKVGLSYRPTPLVSVYATYGEGFETPVIGELRTLPGGAFGFNEALEPQISTNYEIGARGALWQDRIGFELALFHQDIENFISPFGTFPNNTFQNVGKVNQEGIEAGVSVSVVPAVTLGLSYTFSDFLFEEFNNGVADFSDNRLPGVPRHTFHGELRYRDGRGLYSGVEVQSVGRFFTDDANTASNPPYTVLNARAGWEGLGGSRFQFSPFIGVTNIADERYSAFALINDARSRFFNPLPGTSVYGGLEIGF